MPQSPNTAAPQGISFTPVSQGNGTFTLSPEDAARVRAMAMENANNPNVMTPEMQQAINASMGGGDMANYDDVVTDDIHNSISYDIAQKEIEKVTNELADHDKDVIDKLSSDVLDDIAPEKIEIMSREQVEAQYPIINKMPFIEVVAYRRKVDEDILRWKSCKAMIKAVRDYRLPDDLNRETMLANALGNHGLGHIKEEEFDDLCTDTIETLELLAEYLQKSIDGKKNTMDSTSKITDDMLSIIDSRLETLVANKSNNIQLIQKLERTKKAFSNREDLSYINAKLTAILPSSKKVLRKVLRDDLQDLKDKKKTKIMKELEAMFSPEIVKNMYVILRSMYGSDTKQIYATLYFIHRIMTSERNSGYDSWVKVCVLNMSDIVCSIYDLGDDNAQAKYLLAIRDVFSKVVTMLYDSCADIRYPDGLI